MNISIEIPEPKLTKSASSTSLDLHDTYRAINAVTRPGKDGILRSKIPFTTSPSLAALRQDSSYSTKDS